MTTLSTLSDLVNITPVKTPMHMYLHHRIFRCLGLAGPFVLFSLNSSAGPTRQSHRFVSSSSRNRRPCTRARTPLRRRRSRAASSPLQAAAAPELSTAPPPARDPTSPALLLRSRSRAHAAPVPPTRRSSPPPMASPHARSLSCSDLPPTLVHSRSI